MNAIARRVRAHMAWLLAFTLLIASLIPSMGVQAAPATQKTVPSLRMIFSAKYYADYNLDVREKYGYDEEELYNHYMNFGIKEGRSISPILELHAYKAGNADLRAAFGDDWLLYVWHFLNYGIYENANGQRSNAGILFNPVVFLEENPEVRQITGGDLLLTVQYYIEQGMPKGNWVNPPWIAPTASNSLQSSSSEASSSNDSGSSHDSDDNGGSGESSVPEKPIKPDDGDEDIPPAPEEPDPEPVEHEHTKNSFDEFGHCMVAGCMYTLAEFQADCTVDHSAIDEGEYCDNCGAEGTNVSESVHDKNSVHTRNSFGADGLCTRGCGLTLTEFQENCSNAANHGEILFGEVCQQCGHEGTKIVEANCPNRGQHKELHIDETCGQCGVAGELKYAMDECPNRDAHAYGKSCNLCTYVGECLMDHDAIYTTKHCDVCGVAGTKVCEVDHDEIPKGEFCPECGAEGTKEEPVEPEPFVCPKADMHADLHLGVACDGEGCNYVGEAPHEFADGRCQCGAEDPDYVPPHEHDWSNKDGVCADCKEPCSEDHAVGIECPTCGYRRPAEEPECTEEDHAADKLACGATCQKCNAFVAPEHQFVPTGCLRCGATCPDADSHDDVPCGGGCATCQWTPQSTHTFVDSVCERCGYVCPHSYYKGKCDWCGATTFYCTNAFHQTCPPADPSVMCPECGQPSGTGHAFLSDTGVCNDCGAKDPNWTGPVYAYTPENCPGHAYGESEKCTNCGAVKNSETLPEGEDGDVASGIGDEANDDSIADDDENADAEATTEQLPEALPVEYTEVEFVEVTDDDEPDKGQEEQGKADADAVKKETDAEAEVPQT